MILSERESVETSVVSQSPLLLRGRASAPSAPFHPAGLSPPTTIYSTAFGALRRARPTCFGGSGALSCLSWFTRPTRGAA